MELVHCIPKGHSVMSECNIFVGALKTQRTKPFTIEGRQSNIHYVEDRRFTAVAAKGKEKRRTVRPEWSLRHSRVLADLSITGQHTSDVGHEIIVRPRSSTITGNWHNVNSASETRTCMVPIDSRILYSNILIGLIVKTFLELKAIQFIMTPQRHSTMPYMYVF